MARYIPLVSCPWERWLTLKPSPPQQLAQTNAEMVLANTYHLHLQPGEDLVAEAGGLHKIYGLVRPHADRFRRLSGL